ncbi:MAG: sn-glycerol-3-phosphate ABC transporter ATP-binding protein UgpC [Tissierellaceae bacterium]
MANLWFRKVCKRYENGFEAVKDFDLEIEDKEFIIFVGPSGCGKSTTLRMIAGLEHITDGEIYIDGKLINNVEPKDRDIAMVFQNYALYPHMTVFGNMAFSLKLRKVPKDEIKKQVVEAAGILGIEDLLDRKPKQLSGGQRQRVAIGRAIVRNPKVFLFDEPLSNLDAKLRVQMRIELAKLHQSLKTTFIYVTHDQTEAMTLGTRIVVMKDGLIQQVDSPLTIYSKPVNKFVAGFIGSPQMNFIDSKLENIGGELCFKIGDHLIFPPFEKAQVLLDNNYMGKEITIGIRVEDIHDAKFYPEASESNMVGAKVIAKELLGAEIYLYLTLGKDEIIAKVDPRTDVKIGSQISLAIDVNKLHFFDIESEKAIGN